MTNQHGGPRPAVRPDDGRYNNPGGYRPGAGRPNLMPDEVTLKKTIMIPESYWEFLKTIGAGNASQGIRDLIKAAREEAEGNHHAPHP